MLDFHSRRSARCGKRPICEMLKREAGCPAATNSLRVNMRCPGGELRAAGLSGFQTNSQMSSGSHLSSGSAISLSQGDQPCLLSHIFSWSEHDDGSIFG